MLLIFLLLIIYFSIGFGLSLMVCLTDQHMQMESILGENYSFHIMYLWPWILKKIFNYYHK